MRYFGSKGSVAPQLWNIINSRNINGTFCDPFGGIGIVGTYFKTGGFEVHTGDILTFPHFFQVARIVQNRAPSFTNLVKALSLRSNGDVTSLLRQAKCRDGWFIEQYSRDRMFFTFENAQKIEGCRKLIDDWIKHNLISHKEKAVLLASLANSMDKVANTAGTYYAYLKFWHRKALIPFEFNLIQPAKGNSNCQSFLCDAKELVKKKHYDVIYLDPPYNKRDYGSYYHLVETICNNDTPDIHGKSGIFNVQKVSKYNKPNFALNALQELLEEANFRLLVFHYTDDGIIGPEEVRSLLRNYGSIDDFYLDAQGYSVKKESSRIVKHHVYLVNHE